MTAPTFPGDARPSLETEVEFAGYDPYIVALTGGRPADVSSAPVSVRTNVTENQATESRKVKLMTWLREHRA